MGQLFFNLEEIEGVGDDLGGLAAGFHWGPSSILRWMRCSMAASRVIVMVA
jgi:hypothetical protein